MSEIPLQKKSFQDWENNLDGKRKEARIKAHRIVQAIEADSLVVEMNTVAEFGKPLVDVAYQKLKERETRQPLPNDKISVKVKVGQPEYERLQAKGISKDEIQKGVFTREQLLNAGFVFLNKMGGGEKALMSGSFQDPDNPEISLDFSQRSMLTRNELDKVYKYQQLHPKKYGLQGENLDEVRKDMLSLIERGAYQPIIDLDNQFVQLLDPPNHYRDEEDTNDWKIVEEYWEDKNKNFMKTNPNFQGDQLELENIVQTGFAKKYYTDIHTFDKPVTYFGEKTVRGHEITAMALRKGKLQDQPSPFLDSGFVYGNNPDIEIMGYRLNMGNLHVFGGHPDYPGLSEMGQADSDQRYIPLGEYINKLYPKDPEERTTVHQNENIAFQDKDTDKFLRDVHVRLFEVARNDKTRKEKDNFSLEAMRHREENAKRHLEYDPEAVIKEAKEGNPYAKQAIKKSHNF